MRNVLVERRFSIHKNPRVRKKVQQHLSGLTNVTLLEPLDYLTFSHLMKQTYLIVTELWRDSGGSRLFRNSPACYQGNYRTARGD
ncbi:hypothetical protein B7C51_00785 [Paenibacillus larvae subsp. pulvifaciens]|uniref:Uncharacterized protein n=1 Tax=Paenibacillus larvae subsp. pulvifaciens TaxID=1477 RepID=A0A1V0UN18_9BACL|nr:hypothetical protein B5S25_18265 [Paenibacillus larvae subsp. pulvifaciens]ARF66649.1 hypothetical protein B7C51_00785 [Paenibacillus larvae subsp. pulvifaciens]